MELFFEFLKFGQLVFQIPGRKIIFGAFLTIFESFWQQCRVVLMVHAYTGGMEHLLRCKLGIYSEWYKLLAENTEIVKNSKMGSIIQITQFLDFFRAKLNLVRWYIQIRHRKQHSFITHILQIPSQFLISLNIVKYIFIHWVGVASRSLYI